MNGTVKGGNGCAQHTFPKYRPGGSLRSIGTVEYQQCNDCLAMKIIFTADVLSFGVWTVVTDEKIVEPAFYNKGE